MENAYTVVERFAAKYERSHGDKFDGGPPWDDGSPESALLAIHWHLEPMIGNGGWPSVYYNNVGWCVPIAAKGYRLLGMDECAARCERAVELVRAAERAHPKADHASSDWLGGRLMEAIADEVWDQLDGGWFELVAVTDERMARYIGLRGL